MLAERAAHGSIRLSSVPRPTDLNPTPTCAMCSPRCPRRNHSPRSKPCCRPVSTPPPWPETPSKSPPSPHVNSAVSGALTNLGLREISVFHRQPWLLAARQSVTRRRDTVGGARVRLGLNAGAFGLLTPPESDIERRKEAPSPPAEIAVNRKRLCQDHGRHGVDEARSGPQRRPFESVHIFVSDRSRSLRAQSGLAESAGTVRTDARRAECLVSRPLRAFPVRRLESTLGYAALRVGAHV